MVGVSYAHLNERQAIGLYFIYEGEGVLNVTEEIV